jgi:hypothetical protein
MTNKTYDTKARAAFPPAPVAASEFLVPITSWPEMFRETEATGVEFDLFWYDSVEDGVAYFFSWLAEPRATVLVVWDVDGPTHIECRKEKDLSATEAESLPIIAAITHMFCSAGFWDKSASH